MRILFLLFFIFSTVTLADEVLMKNRPLAARSNECQLCHIKRIVKNAFIPKNNSTTKEHFEINLVHGNLKRSCNDCHDVNNSNKLLPPATFTDTSVLCSRCHIERYTDWKNGTHGKKTTSWKNNVSFHCIDCHNPHDVTFKEMQAKPAPKSLHH